MKQSDLMIFLVDQAWLDSRWCAQEFFWAIGEDESWPYVWPDFFFFLFFFFFGGGGCLVGCFGNLDELKIIPQV